MLTGTGDSRTEIVPEQWRKILVALDNPETPANTLWLTMLRSTQWVSTASCRVGGRVYVELEELGLKGWATVREIAPCPEIQPRAGRVVTATFNHYGSDVLELRMEGQTEPLRATSRHPIFSETRQDWVRAADLKPGELLRTANGPVRLESVTRVPGTHRVYNMEVEADHRYFTGEAGVLSHNTGFGCGKKLNQPLSQYDLDTYDDFTKRAKKFGRGPQQFRGHELLQHGFKKGNGLTPEKRLKNTASKQNPVISLDLATHQRVDALQRVIPQQYGKKHISELHPLQVIAANAKILRQVGVPNNVVQELIKATVEHANTMFPLTH